MRCALLCSFLAEEAVEVVEVETSEVSCQRSRSKSVVESGFGHKADLRAQVSHHQVTLSPNIQVYCRDSEGSAPDHSNKVRIAAKYVVVCLLGESLAFTL